MRCSWLPAPEAWRRKVIFSHLPTMLAAFLASFVEFVEALTVILAVGGVRGWRPALAGAGAALCVLCVIILLMGPFLFFVPRRGIQLVTGVLLLAIGQRWLRKAILRAAGIIPMRDEAEIFAAKTASLRTQLPAAGFDKAALATSFQVTMLEGVEVVFIIIGIGAGAPILLAPAVFGASLALAIVALLGFAVHKPLAKVPENKMKFLTGVLLCAFGVFALGEGAGLHWPGGDKSLLALVFLVLGGALAAVRAKRNSTNFIKMLAPGKDG